MMIDNQQNSETAVANNLEDFQFEKMERDNYFEPVKLNLPGYEEGDDPNIASLFGEQDFNKINSFIYEKDLVSTSKFNNITNIFNKSKNIFNKANKKIAIGAVAAVALVYSVNVGINMFDFDSNFVADASPMAKIETQNIMSKTSDIKSQIALGGLYNENYTVAYKLTEDDTLGRISEKTNIPPEAIKVMNNISNEKELLSRESLIIPTKESIVHKISPKDTLSSIAQKYKVSVKEITDMNKGNLKNPDFLQLDQLLFIPLIRNSGSLNSLSAKKNTDSKTTNKKVASKNSVSRENNIVHKLASGETFESIAKKYKVSLEKLMASNPKLDPSRLQISQTVIIPVNPINRSGSRQRGTRIASRSLMSGDRLRQIPLTGKMLWPAIGEHSSGFGHRWGTFHRGVDVAAVVGTPINSAMQGEVIYTGWESGYGQTVEIKHPNGIVTRYAHCSKIFVSVGQSVGAGQHIAAIGMTGHVTGPHVHFEVLVDGVQVNPSNYL